MTNVTGKFTQVITGDGKVIKTYPSIKPITMTGIEELEKDLKEAKESLQRMRDKLNELKDSEPEYEKDTWYRFIDGRGTPYFVKNETIIGDRMKGPEFRPVGSYTKNGYGNLNQLERKATQDEMQEVFVAEAKRRGLIVGTTASCLDDHGKAKIEDRKSPPIYDYWANDDCLWAWSNHPGGSIVIYKDGQWAEKIDDTD